jgi:hypothetical protein
MSNARAEVAGFSSTTRGVVGGGWLGTSYTSNILYITIATTGNSTSFGSMGAGNNGEYAACSNSTRGLFAGNTGGSNVIQYVTIASTGNTTSFGTLISPLQRLCGTASPTRALFAAGGADNSSFSNVIQYVTIASTGNATDFGDLIYAVQGCAATSNCHGGL